MSVTCGEMGCQCGGGGYCGDDKHDLHLSWLDALTLDERRHFWAGKFPGGGHCVFCTRPFDGDEDGVCFHCHRDGITEAEA